MQYATGKYIGFVDSDDWIERDMYQILYKYTNQEEYVVVRGKFVYEHEASDEKNSDIINTDAIIVLPMNLKSMVTIIMKRLIILEALASGAVSGQEYMTEK